VGSIVPENFAEYVLWTICLLLGSVLWAIVVGTICGLTATGDPHEIKFRQSMDSLNYFLVDMDIPQPVRGKTREYLRQTRDLSKHQSYFELVDMLSPNIRSEVILTMSEATLKTVPYLAECGSRFLIALAVKVVRACFAPREQISSLRLNILMRGVAAKAGYILTEGSYWGEDIIITSPALRDLRSASALSYVEVATISRADLDEVMEQHPQDCDTLRQGALLLATNRASKIIAEYYRLHAAKRRITPADPSSNSPADGEDLMDEALDSKDPIRILHSITGMNARGIDEDGEIVELNTGNSESEATDSAGMTAMALLKIEHMLEALAVRQEHMEADITTIKQHLRSHS